MVNDKLAEFNGIKPNFTLEEGEEKIGTPVNARSCKHLISLLGEQYEEARLEYMNPGGPPLKGLPVRRPRAQNSQNHSTQKLPSNPSPDSSGSHNKVLGATSTSKSTKPTSVPSSKPFSTSAAPQNAKPSSSSLLKVIKGKVQAKKREKRGKKKKNDDDDSMEVDDDENNMDDIGDLDDDVDMDEDENDDEDEDVKPTKQSVVPSKRPKKRAKEDSEIEGEEEEAENNPNKRPKKPSASHKGKSPVKKPNKGNEAISETEDDSDSNQEDNDKKSTLVKGKGKKISNQKPAPPKAKAPAKAISKPSSRKRTRKDESETDDDDANDSDNQADRKTPSTSKKIAPKGKPASKRQKVEEEEEGDEPEDNDERDDDEEEEGDDDDDGGDELASIKGIKPNVLMEDGEEMEVQSQTSSSTYKVKRTWDHYYCTCPVSVISHLTSFLDSVFFSGRLGGTNCKHLISLLGEKYEAARIKLKNPDGAALRAPNSKKKSSKKGKNTGDDDDKGSSSKTDIAVLLANSWDVDKGPDPTGWWVSEKLDGVRTFYDGKRMYSRLGNPFTPPQWFLDKLPKDVTLDGELFGGRGEFQNTVSIVKTMNSPHWKGITFHIFDIPSLSTQPFEARLEHLKKLFAPGTGSYASDKVIIVEQEKAKSRKHVLDKLKEIESLGGEGLMLRKPGSLYEGKRSSTLLKIKSFYDAEAVVTGYKPGKGRNAGVTGALKCKMASGKTFDVGSGLNDKQRKSPPKIGSIIVYRFQELTKDGVPRFPTYLGEAADKTKPKDAVVPDHRKAGAKKSDAPSE